MERIAGVVTASDKALGIFVGTPTDAVAWRDRGARYLLTGLEPLLLGSTKNYLETVRSTEGATT
jgi:2-keto-3-deoxy-L-rhamnonate aldolase RhmA